MDKAKTQEIITALQGGSATLSTASGRISAAISHAQQVQTRMVAAGFHGVAQGIAGVIGSLQQIQGQLGAHGAAIGTGVGIISEITSETTPNDVKAKLAAATGTVGSTRSAIVATLTSIAQAKQRVASALQGGQPGPLINLIDAARQLVAQANTQLDTAGQRISEANTEARHAGN